VDRALLLSDPKHYKKNLSHIITILLENNYPLPFIFETINHRIINLSERRAAMQDSTNNENQEIKSSWFTIPYIPSFTDKFKRFNNKDLKVFFFSLNKLNKFIKV